MHHQHFLFFSEDNQGQGTCVAMHQHTQKVHAELVEQCLTSAKADEECSKITNFLVNACVKNWQDTAFDFVAHTQAQMDSHCEHDPDQWFDATEDISELDPDLPFDENGKH